MVFALKPEKRDKLNICNKSDLSEKIITLKAFVNAGLNELSTVSVDNSVYETLRTSAAPAF